VKNKSDDESQETGENNGKNDKSKLDTESILMNLMKQINFLHETNSKMFRNLQGERRKFHEISIGKFCEWFSSSILYLSIEFQHFRGNGRTNYSATITAKMTEIRNIRTIH
jgi:hypothetical protein